MENTRSEVINAPENNPEYIDHNTHCPTRRLCRKTVNASTKIHATRPFDGVYDSRCHNRL